MNDFARATEAALVGPLQVLSDLLDELIAHAEERDVEPTAFLEARLFEDMFPFWRQVYSACNVARRCVDRLSGSDIHDPPKPAPTPDALRERLAETMAYIQSADATAIGATESAPITAKLAKQPVALTGRTYVTNFALPNLLFHVVTAYNILRHNGIDIGKHSYLRPVINQAASPVDVIE